MIDCNSNLSPLIFMTTLLNRYHQMELTFYFTMLKLFKRVVRENFCSYLQKFSISNDRHPESGKQAGFCSDNKSNSCFRSHFLSSHFALRSYQFYTFLTLIKTGVLPLQNCRKPSSSICSYVLDFFLDFKLIYCIPVMSKQIC